MPKAAVLDAIPAAAYRLRMQKALAAQQAELLAPYRWRDGAARPSQLMPDGDWYVWLIQTGRGWGKTRAGAEAVREVVESGQAKRIALVAETAADARDVMVEGESGIVAISPPNMRPDYEPSKRRLTWPNGAIATTYSADDPEQLRGPQHDFAWADEIGKWARPAAWDNLMFGLRLGQRPRVIATTTPRPVSLVRRLQKQPGVVVTTGTTFDNSANLAPAFLAEVSQRYEGTRMGRQELYGELLDDVEGALWQRSWIDAERVAVAPSELRRIVVGVDPAGGARDDSAQQGIVVAAKGADGQFYVLFSRGYRLSPRGWAEAAIDAYRRFEADRIVAEKNYGGEMVQATIRQVDRSVPLTIVSAARGKVARAEPIAALYEQGRVSHVGSHDALEDQMCAFPVGDGLKDLVDAAVWALSSLLEKRRMRAV